MHRQIEKDRKDRILLFSFALNSTVSYWLVKYQYFLCCSFSNATTLLHYM